jgi:hypothetical protein
MCSGICCAFEGGRVTGMEEQTCPLCGSAAKYAYADHKNEKHFDCPECGDFRVSATAEQKLLTAPSDWRSQIRQKIKEVSPDHLVRLVIPSGVVRTEGTAYPSLDVQVVSREGLPN